MGCVNAVDVQPKTEEVVKTTRVFDGIVLFTRSAQIEYCRNEKMSRNACNVFLIDAAALLWMGLLRFQSRYQFQFRVGHLSSQPRRNRKSINEIEIENEAVAIGDRK